MELLCASIGMASGRSSLENYNVCRSTQLLQICLVFARERMRFQSPSPSLKSSEVDNRPERRERGVIVLPEGDAITFTLPSLNCEVPGFQERTESPQEYLPEDYGLNRDTQSVSACDNGPAPAASRACTCLLTDVPYVSGDGHLDILSPRSLHREHGPVLNRRPQSANASADEARSYADLP